MTHIGWPRPISPRRSYFLHGRVPEGMQPVCHHRKSAPRHTFFSAVILLIHCWLFFQLIAETVSRRELDSLAHDRLRMHLSTVDDTVQHTLTTLLSVLLLTAEETSWSTTRWASKEAASRPCLSEKLKPSKNLPGCCTQSLQSISWHRSLKHSVLSEGVERL